MRGAGGTLIVLYVLVCWLTPMMGLTALSSRPTHEHERTPLNTSREFTLLEHNALLQSEPLPTVAVRTLPVEWREPSSTRVHGNSTERPEPAGQHPPPLRI